MTVNGRFVCAIMLSSKICLQAVERILPPKQPFGGISAGRLLFVREQERDEGTSAVNIH